MTALASGIHAISGETYHADPCEKPSLTATVARILCTQSPIHAWAAHPRLNPDYVNEEAERFDIGTAAHALLLEGETSVEVVDAADWRTAAAKEARDAAREAGRQPLLVKQWDELQRMVDAARVQLARIAAEPPIFSDGLAEQTLIWEEAGGIICRAKLDWLRDDHTAIDDYKTTARSANPEPWSRSLFSMGYDVQAAFYLRGLEAVTGSVATWRWVVQETAAPYALAVISLTPAALEFAQAKADYAISRWRECVTANEWPGYPTEVCFAELPAWEETRWLEKEAREFV